ncbi:peroxiredoxin [Chryseobacterium ginsenosidimutans]|uniref:peroxiredoxin family protein n=1 Tax=Chryseobacterium ginsenosidimutans TaxID=687846 RepID=UPI0021695A67|nr:peroxiredoxin family protein [Chryseobacterium ginsenosidimutans]MCS3870465.1 peroxiredoxin [Chryseobacterium ginsenosidimutans]
MKNTGNFQLETRLKKLRDFWGSKLTPAENETMERHIEFLRESGALDKVLKKGDLAPEFNLKNQNGQIISSSELLKNGPLVISFYRGSWCPYCVEEVKALDLFYPQIQENGADLVVLSPQSFTRTEKQAEELHLKYNLLVDEDNKTGKAFGLVYEFPQYLKNLYTERFNNNIQEINEGFCLGTSYSGSICNRTRREYLGRFGRSGLPFPPRTAGHNSIYQKFSETIRACLKFSYKDFLTLRS